VAYERYREVFGPGEPISTAIIVRDLRTGRVLHDTPITAGEIPEVESFVSIVVKSDGAAAWIVEARQYVGDYQVHVVDTNGSRVLAVTSEIELHSRALGGNTVYWTQERKPMSAPLN
jgi:hypothetical protein